MPNRSEYLAGIRERAGTWRCNPAGLTGGVGAALMLVLPGATLGAEPNAAAGLRSAAGTSTNAILAALGQTAPASGELVTENPFLRWWETNQPPSRLSSGLVSGTDVVSGIGNVDNTIPPTLRRPGDGAVQSFLRWGPVSAHLNLNYGLTYGTGLLGARRSQEDTLINSVSPGISLSLGSRWNVSYTPTAVFYDSDAFRDTVNHAVRLAGNLTQGTWDFSISNNFLDADSPLVETGLQNHQIINGTRIAGKHAISEEWTTTIAADQSLRWTDQFNNVYSWGLSDSTEYRVRPNLAIEGVVSLGYDSVDPGSDMWNQRVTLGIRGNIGQKINYHASGGVEFRQFTGAAGQSAISPLFDVGVNYQVFESTSLGIRYVQQVGASYFADQYTQSNTIEATLTQRVMGRFQLALTGGFRSADNKSTVGLIQVQQTSDFQFARLSIGTRFLARGFASMFFQWSENSSNLPGLSFTSRQVGLQLSYSL